LSAPPAWSAAKKAMIARPTTSVGQDRDRADDHADRHRHGAAREQVEHQAEGGDLRRHPADVAEDDHDRAGHFDAAAEALAVVVADGEEGHAVELGGEEHADEHQAHARAERVLDHRAEAALDEPGRDAEHGLGAEPRREGRGDDHVQRQVAAGDCEVGGILHAPRRPEADRDGDEEVRDDERQQHSGRLVFHQCAARTRTRSLR
jgi:hypothetical protein